MVCGAMHCASAMLLFMADAGIKFSPWSSGVCPHLEHAVGLQHWKLSSLISTRRIWNTSADAVCPSLSIIHSFVKNSHFSLVWPPYRLSLAKCSLIISPCAFPMGRWIWASPSVVGRPQQVLILSLACFDILLSAVFPLVLQQSGSWSVDFEF